MNKLRYLALQSTLEGQASFAHVHEIINGLRERGWIVELVQPHVRPSYGWLKRAWAFFLVQCVFIFRQLVDPQPLYVRSHFAALPSSFVAWLTGTVVVQELNGPDDDLFMSWPWTRRVGSIFKWALRTQLKMASGIVTNTDDLGDWIRSEVGPCQTRTIPNGANVNIFRPDADTSWQLPDRFVLFFGAFSVWQGIEVILDAIHRPEWPEDVSVVFAGDGPERSAVETAALRDSRVVYLGKVPYLDMPGIVAKSIAGLSPKSPRPHSETGWSPLKVYEILACGVPAIVTDLRGQSEIVRDNNCGIVISPRMPDELAKAVAVLAGEPELGTRLGEAGHAAVNLNHSWDRRAEATHQFLIEICSTNPEWMGREFT